MKLGRFGCAVKIAVGVLLLALIVFGLARGAGFSSHPYVGTPTPELPPGILWHLGPIPISNTMVTAWVSMSILIVLFVLGTRKMKLVPRGLQNFLEWGVETLLNLVEDSVGKEKRRRSTREVMASICSSETGRFCEAMRMLRAILVRSNGSRRSSFLITMRGISSTRSYVVKR